LIEFIVDELLDQLPGVLPFGGLLRFMAKGTKAAINAYVSEVGQAELSPAEISDAIRSVSAQEFEEIVRHHLEARPDIPEQRKVDIRSALVALPSEIDRVINELEDAERKEQSCRREAAARAARDEAAARAVIVKKMSRELARKLKGGHYEDAYRIAEAILALDPEHKAAQRAERLALRKAYRWPEDFWLRSISIYVLSGLSILYLGKFFFEFDKSEEWIVMIAWFAIVVVASYSLAAYWIHLSRSMRRLIFFFLLFIVIISVLIICASLLTPIVVDLIRVLTWLFG